MLSIEKGGYKHERDLYQGFFPCYYVLNSYHKSCTSEIFFFILTIDVTTLCGIHAINVPPYHP